MTLKMVSKREFDQQKRFVRIRKRARGFVEFDFAIGDPSIYIELILPEVAFEEFCKKNQAVHMTQQQAEAVDRDMQKWRYGKQD